MAPAEEAPPTAMLPLYPTGRSKGFKEGLGDKNEIKILGLKVVSA